MSSGTTTVSTVSAVNSRASSPVGDSQDDSSNKLMIYLHQLAGSHEAECDVIVKDHCYAKPWNWKPESVFVKPVKKLFFSKSQNTPTKKNKLDQDNIDVEQNDAEPPSPPYDLSRIRQTMDEFYKVASFIRSEDTDDWEEKIDKILWSPVQNRIFNRVVRILNAERTARLSKEKSLHEPILRRTSIDSTAKRFRETLASANWDWRITQWLHSLLFDHLPHNYLTIYLDILQALRQKIPQLIDKMIAVQPNVNSKNNSATWESLGPLLKKNWDPVSPILNMCKQKKLPGNPILVVIPNGMSGTISSRQQKWINQLGMLGTVVTVNTNLGLNANRLTVLAGMDQLIQASRTKIQDVKVDYSGRPIVLIGFNSGAALACQVAAMEHVTTVICLGFPYSTADGRRGSPDDILLDLRSPVMFVIGQNSTLARVDDIEDVRERMLVPTSLVVVGSADDHLRISTSKKISERISQSMVDRCVIDEISDFVASVLTCPSPLPMRSTNCNESRNRRGGDTRKRKTSTSSSVDSEPQSPNIKKIRPHSPMQINAINHISNIATNVLPRGTLVTLTGTAATQTPKRKPRANFANQNFNEQHMTSRISSQSNIDSSTGGITLNIGSLASLAPVGPIRFESTPISLQVSPAGKTNGNTIKTTNTFIRVPKGSNQVNVGTGTAQNVAKIKMIVPQRKPAQRVPVTYKNVNIADKAGEVNMVNMLTPANASIRVGTQTATVTNAKAVSGSVSTMNALPSIQTPKTSVNLGSASSVGKSATSTNVVFTPKNSSTTMPTGTPTKVGELPSCGSQQEPGAPKKLQPQSQAKVPRLTPLGNGPNRPSKPYGLSAVCSTTDRSAAKSNAGFTDTSRQFRSANSRNYRSPSTSTIVSTSIANTNNFSHSTNTSSTNTSLDDLENILDMPIIFANDGENLSGLESLPAIPSPASTSSPDICRAMPPLVSTAMSTSKVLLINGKSLQQSQQHVVLGKSGAQKNAGPQAQATGQIKYTKIILTKRSEDEGNKLVFAKSSHRAAGKLLLVDSKGSDVKYIQGATRISGDYVVTDATDVEAKTSAKNSR